MRKLLGLLAIAVMIMCVSTVSADDLTTNEISKQVGEIVKQVNTLSLVGNESGIDSLYMATKVGDYYKITMKYGKYISLEKIQKAVYLEWAKKYQTR